MASNYTGRGLRDVSSNTESRPTASIRRSKYHTPQFSDLKSMFDQDDKTGKCNPNLKSDENRFLERKTSYGSDVSYKATYLASVKDHDDVSKIQKSLTLNSSFDDGEVSWTSKEQEAINRAAESISRLVAQSQRAKNILLDNRNWKNEVQSQILSTNQPSARTRNHSISSVSSRSDSVRSMSRKNSDLGLRDYSSPKRLTTTRKHSDISAGLRKNSGVSPSEQNCDDLKSNSVRSLGISRNDSYRSVSSDSSGCSSSMSLDVDNLSTTQRRTSTNRNKACAMADEISTSKLDHSFNSDNNSYKSRGLMKIERDSDKAESKPVLHTYKYNTRPQYSRYTSSGISKFSANAQKGKSDLTSHNSASKVMDIYKSSEKSRSITSSIVTHSSDSSLKLSSGAEQIPLTLEQSSQSIVANRIKMIESIAGKSADVAGIGNMSVKKKLSQKSVSSKELPESGVTDYGLFLKEQRANLASTDPRQAVLDDEIVLKNKQERLRDEPLPCRDDIGNKIASSSLNVDNYYDDILNGREDIAESSTSEDDTLSSATMTDSYLRRRGELRAAHKKGHRVSYKSSVRNRKSNGPTKQVHHSSSADRISKIQESAKTINLPDNLEWETDTDNALSDEDKHTGVSDVIPDGLVDDTYILPITVVPLPTKKSKGRKNKSSQKSKHINSPSTSRDKTNSERNVIQKLHNKLKHFRSWKSAAPTTDPSVAPDIENVYDSSLYEDVQIQRQLPNLLITAKGDDLKKDSTSSSQLSSHTSPVQTTMVGKTQLGRNKDRSVSAKEKPTNSKLDSDLSSNRASAPATDQMPAPGLYELPPVSYEIRLFGSEVSESIEEEDEVKLREKLIPPPLPPRNYPSRSAFRGGSHECMLGSSIDSLQDSLLLSQIPPPAKTPSKIDKSKLSELESNDPFYDPPYEEKSIDFTDDFILLRDRYKSHFNLEPLYQYTSNELFSNASTVTSDSDLEEEYESDNADINRTTSQSMPIPSILDISATESDKDSGLSHSPTNAPVIANRVLTNNTAQRTLWCEKPEVIASGILKKISNEEKKLQEAIFEIITSEASYFKSLNVFINVFVSSDEMQANYDKVSVLTTRDRQILFSNVIAVYGASERFLEDLESRWRENIYISDISDIIISHATGSFEPYVRYCSNKTFQDRKYNELIKDSEFLTAVRKLEHSPECQNLPMSSFFLLPMQRITRLPLLMDAVCRKIEVATPRHKSALKAIDALNKVVKRCNDAAKRMERTEELCLIDKELDFKVKKTPLISAARYLVKRGELNRIHTDKILTFGRSRPSKMHIYIFLFNDLLLIGKKKNDNQFIITDYCPRSSVQVKEIRDVSTCSLLPAGVPSSCKHFFLLALLDNHENKQIQMVLSPNTPTDHARWLDALKPRVEVTHAGEKIYEEWDCPQVQATAPYLALQPDELSLEKTDIVNVTRKMADGWYEGERIRDGERGWFPASCVQEIDNYHVKARNLQQKYRRLMASDDFTDQPPNS